MSRIRNTGSHILFWYDPALLAPPRGSATPAFVPPVILVFHLISSDSLFRSVKLFMLLAVQICPVFILLMISLVSGPNFFWLTI
jgi:hypothetical protein